MSTTTESRPSNKPSYQKLALGALSTTTDNMTLEKIAEYIQTTYGKCSIKCLQKAMSKAISDGCIVNGDSDTYNLSADKRKAFRRKRRAVNRKPKALTSYNVYVQQEIRKRRTNKQKVTTLMKDIASDWKNLSESAKAELVRLAAQTNAAAAASQ